MRGERKGGVRRWRKREKNNEIKRKNKIYRVANKIMTSVKHLIGFGRK